MTTTTAALPVSIEAVESVRMDPTVGWERRLVLDTERRTVEVRESVGSGRPEREYYGLDPVLGGLPLDLASFDRIGGYLASDAAQSLLRSLCDDDFSGDTDEDGSEAWQDIVQRLNDGITEAVEATPRYWDAGDFFQYASEDGELFGEGFNGSDEAIDLRAHLLCGEAAMDGQRLVVSEVRDYLRRQWTDAVASVRDDLTDDDDELFAEVDAGEWTLDDLAACLRDGRRSLSLVAIGAVLAERLAARTTVTP
jgi:hypothetical protein